MTLNLSSENVEVLGGDMVHSENRRDSASCRSGSGDEDGGGGVDKKVRHNKVEQNRREMTRKYVAELQEMLPNMVDSDPGANINVVLEGALDYLRSLDGGAPCAPSDKKRGQTQRDTSGLPSSENDDASRQVMAGRACGQINLSNLRFASAFDSAPFGMAVARCDGRILKCNNMFERILSFAPGALLRETMFSLTAPSDLPYTMQVNATLHHAAHLPALIFSEIRAAQLAFVLVSAVRISAAREGW